MIIIALKAGSVHTIQEGSYYIFIILNKNDLFLM